MHQNVLSPRHRTERPVIWLGCLALLLASSLVSSVGLAQRSETTGKKNQDKKGAETAPIAPIAQKIPSKVASEGLFTDSANQKHSWQINVAHALIWDGKPYIPVGSTFTPRSLTDPDASAWQADQATLATLKSRGLIDIILSPDRPLAEVPPKALQRVIDHLDANGFRYGVAFGPGITRNISGTVIKPTVYRVDARPTPDNALLTAEWVASYADRAEVVFYDGGNDSNLYNALKINVVEGIATVPIEIPAKVTHPYALLIPHKTLPPSDKGTLPDLWTEYDRYRDQTLGVTGQIKWGAGLRFFLDPLAKHLGLSGEAPFLVPDSTAFRLEWESFLTRKYGNVQAIRNKWGLLKKIEKISDIARLVPLWAYGRGCPSFYDPDTQTFFTLLDGNQSASTSSWWSDFQSFRDTSIGYYLNAMADLLKRNVANVPVVYTWTPNGNFFTNYQAQGGFDGLAVATRIGETARLQRTVGPAYGQAEQSQRTSWFLADEIAGPEPAAPVAKPVAGPKPTNAVLTDVSTAPPSSAPTVQNANGGETTHSPLTKQALNRDLDDLRHAGIKGFFLSGVTPVDKSTAGWSGTPDSLSWIGDYSTALHNDSGAGALRPQVLFFPQNAPGPAQTGFVPGANNVFWLPGAYYGEAIDLWPFCSGYNIRRDVDDELTTVLVSYHGAQKAHFAVGNSASVRAYTPDGRPVPVKATTKNIVEILLDKTPTIIQFRSDISPVPEEAATYAYVQLNMLYEIAKLQKIFGAETSSLAVDRAKDFLFKKNYNQAYVFARAELDRLTSDAAPYIWLEGEQDRFLESKNPLFNEIAGHPEASNGVYLRLATPNRPNPVYGYHARYEFNANHAGTYQIWLAGSLAGPNTSPIKWNIDLEPDRDIAEPNPHGPLYMNERFGWMLLGTAKLDKGEHKLTIDVTDPAAATHEYAFAIDALMITDKPFAPNGTVRPLPVDDVMERDIVKQMKSVNVAPRSAP